jgi:uncharacterized protein (DUF58 family)
MPQSTESTASARSPFLDLKALSALAHMRFVTKHQIDGAYSGRHRSRQQGGAAEFADYREYVEGEDLRRLDWKVLARTGRAYVRLFQDETNLLCTLAIDASGSMLFSGGGRGDKYSKLQHVQWLATAFSHVIARQQDQVGLAVLADGLSDLRPPGSRSAHVQGIQHAIEMLKTQPTTDLATGLRDLFGRLSRRGVLVLMSDFLVEDLESVFNSLRLFRHRHWEIVCLHIIHPEEERLPEGLAYRFEGLENDGRIDASPAEVRKLYEDRFAGHCATVRELSLAAGCDYRRVSTATPYLETLGGFLVERAG